MSKTPRAPQQIRIGTARFIRLRALVRWRSATPKGIDLGEHLSDSLASEIQELVGDVEGFDVWDVDLDVDGDLLVVLSPEEQDTELRVPVTA